MIDPQPDPPFPVIVGVPRSGTTLLRLMLDAHPELAIPPETGFLIPVIDAARSGRLDRAAFVDILVRAPSWPDFQLPPEALESAIEAVEPFSATAAVRAFYRLYASRFSKRRAGDKTPTYATRLCDVEDLLPEARFIHIVRDGRDVALSLRDRWFAPARDMESLARYWVGMISEARKQGARCRYYHEVRYEALVEQPRATLEGVCAFVALPYSPRLERYHRGAHARLDEGQERRDADGNLLISKEERLRQQRRTMDPPDVTRIGVWRRDMTAGERRAFESIAGPLLAREGYEC